MLGIKTTNIQKESGGSFQLCYFSYFSHHLSSISLKTMRLALSVLNILKEMVTVPHLFSQSILQTGYFLTYHKPPSSPDSEGLG